MFGVADYWAFVVAVIVFLAIPGVGNLAIITSTSKGRIVGGLAATLGVIVGDQGLMYHAEQGRVCREHRRHSGHGEPHEDLVPDDDA